MKQLLTISILVLIFVGNAYAPDEQKFKVCVVVDENDEDKTEIQIIRSHMKRELRILGDVEIVDVKGNWEYLISIDTLGQDHQDSTKTNNISIAITYHIRVPKFWFKIYDFKYPDIPMRYIATEMANWHKNSLPALCVSVVDSFDGGILQPARKAHTEIQNLLKNYKENQNR